MSRETSICKLVLLQKKLENWKQNRSDTNWKLDLDFEYDIECHFVSGFRLQFVNAFSGLGSSPSRGYFINSCYAHCQTEMQETWFKHNSPVLNNKVMSSSLLTSSLVFSYYPICFFTSSLFLSGIQLLESSLVLLFVLVDVLTRRTCIFLADNCYSIWRLVFQQKSISEDRLCFSLWQNL